MRRVIFEPEHEAFRDQVRRFMQTEVGPHADRWRAAGMVDRETYLKAGAQGLLCLFGEERFGGAGIEDMRFDQIVIEENMAHGDIGFYINLHSDLVAPYIHKLGTEEQKARFMPGIISGETILAVAMTEPSTGSDLAGMKTRAVKKGDHWLLNGAKTYISNGILSDLVVVAARTDPDRPHGISLFLVERGMAGFERGRKLEKMGLKSQDTAELFFNNVHVPVANLLGEAGQGPRSGAIARTNARAGAVGGRDRLYCHRADRVRSDTCLCEGTPRVRQTDRRVSEHPVQDGADARRTRHGADLGGPVRAAAQPGRADRRRCVCYQAADQRTGSASDGHVCAVPRRRRLYGRIPHQPHVH